MNWTSKLWMTLAAAVLAIFAGGLGGCEKKLTLNNYNKIQVGMSLDQVTSILGPGEKQTAGTATKIAQDYLGEITNAQAQQNQRNLKQGLGDLTGQIQARDQQTQREAGAGGEPANPAAKAAAPRGPQGISLRPDAPIRERWIWTEGKVEISVEFSDDKVTSKNQDGL